MFIFPNFVSILSLLFALATSRDDRPEHRREPDGWMCVKDETYCGDVKKQKGYHVIEMFPEQALVSTTKGRYLCSLVRNCTQKGGVLQRCVNSRDCCLAMPIYWK